MTTSCPQHLWITLLPLITAAADVAHAGSIIAPLGGHSVPLPSERVVCLEASDLHGWSLDADSGRLKPPPEGTSDVLPAILRLAVAGSQCANSNEVVHASTNSVWPVVSPGSILLAVDAGRLDVRGRSLRGAVLRWQSGGQRGSDVCRDPQPIDGEEACAFSVERGLLAEPAATVLAFYPAEVAAEGELRVYDAQARVVRSEATLLAPARVSVGSMFPADASLDTESDVGRIPLKHAEAVGSVDCADAACELEGSDLLVRGEHGSDEVLDVKIRLRPHVYLQSTAGLEPVAGAQIPIQRCPVSVVSAAPLRGVPNQNLVVKVGGRCQKDTSLRFFVPGSTTRTVQTEQEADGLYAVVHVDRVSSEDVVVQVVRGGGVVGIARGHTRAVPAIHARLELPSLGAIDFIPTNRDAAVVLPTLGEGAVLVPLPVDGVYTVTHDGSGERLRGIEGTTGWVAVRLAYRDKTLPPALRDLNLAEFEDAIDRTIKTASIPVVLTADDDSLVQLICNDEAGRPEREKPGTVSSVPYAHRDSCHLVLHRERLLPENGVQTFRVTASVSAVDGFPRAEAAIDQVVRLDPGLAARQIYFGGVMAPFDRVVVRVGVVADQTNYAVSRDEKIGAPPLQWSVVMGTTKLRLYATTSFPTGLFRVADKGHSGILGLNGGVLFRVVYLSEDGHQSPVGLETGVMWLGIAGDTASSDGQFAVVAGIGIGIPIANVARITQATISLHIWGEYEVSRAILLQSGSPWGFVFGPSLSVGDVGVNF